ncbi:MAG: hypothetical protein IKO32_10905 [Lachnospiraceae bacterium]|nr:hypothetical protein [Lachnospiraceae bacterium]
MFYGIWNFGAFPAPAAHARDLVTICAATRLTGIFDEQPVMPNANTVTPVANTAAQNANTAAPGTYNNAYTQPAAVQMPPPFGCGKSTMIQLWELALNSNQEQK